LAKLYQKLAILATLGAVSPHFYRHNGEIWQEGADLRLPSLKPNFVKIAFGKIIPKISNVGYFDD